MPEKEQKLHQNENKTTTQCGCGITFTVIAADRRDCARIKGAVFLLIEDCTGRAQRAATNADGCAYFRVCPGRAYTLLQANAQGEIIRACVDCSGNILVNGKSCCDCTLTVCYSPECKKHSLSFKKIDGLTERALPGAVFTLRSKSEIIAYAVSGLDGIVSFGALRPGRYTLVEVSAPEGYAPDSRTHEVIVKSCGAVLIDGSSAEHYRIKNYPKACVKFKKVAGEN